MLITIQGETNSNCMDLDDTDAELIYNTSEKSCEIKAQLMTICLNETNLKETNITLKSVYCTFHEGSTSAMDESKTSIQPNVTVTHVEITTQPICKCQVAGSVASIGLGAHGSTTSNSHTTGWMWTCWTVKR